MTAVDPGVARWCLGLKSRGFRDLQPHEVDRLRSETTSALLTSWRPALIGVASPGALYASYLLHGDGAEPPWPRMLVVVVLMFAGLLVLPAASLLASRDVVHRWRALRADLRSQRIERFSSGGSPDGAIEVLVHSGLVFLLDGARPPYRMSATVYEAVAPPESTPHWALPAELASRLPDALRQRGVVQRRRLIPAELDELERHRRRLRRPSGSVVGFSVWTGLYTIAAIGSLITGDFANWRPEYLIAFVAVAGATIWQIVRYGRMLSVSRALGRDTAYGWAIVIEHTNDSPSRVEVLPESGAMWSADGAPSDWRLVR